MILLVAVGAQVPPKFYRYNASVVWSPPVDCPVTWQPGPYAMAKVSMKWASPTQLCCVHVLCLCFRRPVLHARVISQAAMHVWR